MRVLVTGGAGFIGSHLVDRLLVDGHAVRVLDNFATGYGRNLQHVANDIELIDGDLRNRDDVARAVDGIELVYHQGALASVPRSIADPQTTFDVNVTGTLNILVAARDAGVRRVVFASSSSVYGDSPVSPKHEGLTPKPLSPYAISKLSGEQLCTVFNSLYDIETVSLRYFNVFGPRQDPSSPYSGVISIFLKRVSQGASPHIFGDGEQMRDFVFVEDVVAANVQAMHTLNANGEVFNVATGQSVTLNQIVSIMEEILGKGLSPVYEPSRSGDIRQSLADISRARRLLRFSPTHSFRSGLERLVMSESLVA